MRWPKRIGDHDALLGWALLFDRAKLLGWALVFVLGVLLINPILFGVGKAVTGRHGLVAGIIAALFAAGFVGFVVTFAAMSRGAELKQLTPERRRKYVYRLYAAAFCFIASIVIEGW